MPSGTAHPVAARASTRPPGSPRADVASGYALSLARIVAWAGVSALVYRRDGPAGFALLALLRGTITLVGYTSLGVGPAMVRVLAEARRGRDGPAGPASDLPIARPAAGAPPTAPPVVLNYAVPTDSPDPVEASDEDRAFITGRTLADCLSVVALLVAIVYALYVDRVHVVPAALSTAAGRIVVCFGIGVAVRAFSEPSSAVLQSRGRLAVDNLILAGGELLWLALAAFAALTSTNPRAAAVASAAALCWAVSAVAVAFARAVGRVRSVPEPRRHPGRIWFPAHARRIVALGTAIVVAQLADFLYAPTDYVIINRLIGPEAVAAYAPAVQVDAALLILVAGIAAAIYPWTAVAHAAGDLARVRRYYVRGTLASLAVLLPAALLAVALAEPMLRVWLGTDQPATRAILPLVLVHTVAGGAGAVGRAVLLGMGRARAFTASVLAAGAAHVLISGLAAALGFGLRGVVAGTIVVVVARSLVWTPWYVTRALREEEERRASS